MAAHDTLPGSADAAGPPPYAQDGADVVAGLGSDAAAGLTAGEAAERLSRYGPNADRRREAAVGVGGGRCSSCATR